MATVPDVTASKASEALLALTVSENPFLQTSTELLPLQLKATEERFKERVEQIKLLQNRAEIGKISEIRTLVDVVPLLFAHTAYKSYPESWLFEQKWDRMGR
jgi:hypothetical protein